MADILTSVPRFRHCENCKCWSYCDKATLCMETAMLDECKPQGWKIGNELAPYHPLASHCPPEYRDGWNACFAIASARIAELEARVAEMERQPLTDAERISLYTQAPNFSHGRALFMAGIKAAERAHRIGTTDATGDAA